MTLRKILSNWLHRDCKERQLSDQAKLVELRYALIASESSYKSVSRKLVITNVELQRLTTSNIDLNRNNQQLRNRKNELKGLLNVARDEIDTLKEAAKSNFNRGE